MGQTELLEETTPELEELDAPEADLDDWGNDELDDDFEGLSSDLDNWDSPEDYYGSTYGSDRSYLFGLLR